MASKIRLGTLPMRTERHVTFTYALTFTSSFASLICFSAKRVDKRIQRRKRKRKSKRKRKRFKRGKRFKEAGIRLQRVIILVAKHLSVVIIQGPGYPVIIKLSAGCRAGYSDTPRL